MECVRTHAELLKQVHPQEHLVRPVAVVLDQNLPTQHRGKRGLLEVDLALGLGGISARALERLAEHRHLAHACLGTPFALLTAPTLGVLSAGHLHRRGRAGEPHRASREARLEPERHPLAADQVRRPRQDVDGGDAARERAFDRGILGPERLFRTHGRLKGPSRLVAVRVRDDPRKRVDTEMRVRIDQTGGDPATLEVDHTRAGGHRKVDPQLLDSALADPDIGAVECGTHRIHHRATEQADLFALRAGSGGLRCR
jgi:hypothetical protein